MTRWSGRPEGRQPARLHSRTPLLTSQTTGIPGQTPTAVHLCTSMNKRGTQAKKDDKCLANPTFISEDSLSPNSGGSRGNSSPMLLALHKFAFGWYDVTGWSSLSSPHRYLTQIDDLMFMAGCLKGWMDDGRNLLLYSHISRLAK